MDDISELNGYTNKLHIINSYVRGDFSSKSDFISNGKGHIINCLAFLGLSNERYYHTCKA